MSKITVPSFATAAGSHWSGNAAYLRIYYYGSNPSAFSFSTGEVWSPSLENFYREITCALASNVVTIPPTIIDSTPDITNRSDVFVRMVLVDASRSEDSQILLADRWDIPVALGSTVTFEQLRIHNETPVRRFDDRASLSRTAIEELIEEAIGAVVIPDATTEVKGKVELATDGETAAGVVVQGNDSRLPTLGQKAALAGTSGTPSNVNRYVTDSDTRLTGALAWFNVKATYGAVGNGVADDTAAINSAIAALNTAGRGVLYFPAGDYLVTGALTAITANGIIRGDGHTDSNSPSIGTYVSRIKCSSATAVLFTVNSPRLTFEHLDLLNSAATTPTAGAGILVTNATNAFQQVDYRSITIEDFYDLLDVQVGNNWSAFNCWFRHGIRYGAHIRNIITADTGGWGLIKCSFVSHTFTGTAIFAESCGSGKVVATNVSAWGKGLVATGSATGIIDICAGSNFEDNGDIPIDITDWHSVKIYGIEFGMWSPSLAGIECIKLTGVKNAEIFGCVFNQPNGGDHAILIHNCEGVNIAPMNPGGYDHLRSTTGTHEPYTEGNDGSFPLTLLNGWTNVGAGWQVAQVKQHGQEVRLSGAIQGGTIVSSASILCNLPLGFRPKFTRAFPARLLSGSGSSCTIIIEPDGDVAQYQAADNGHCAFEISFLP